MYQLLLLTSSCILLTHDVFAKPAASSPYVFEGDMAFTNNQKEIVKAAISEKKDIEIVAGGEKFAATTKAFPKWTNAIVPYTFRGLGSREINSIRQAMAEWERMTCIRFKRRTNQKNYLEFHIGSGCWGHVGMGNGKTQISVGNGCAYRHVMTHEIGHAVGFFHEQSRTDRDDWIYILWQNVPAAYKEAFAKYGRDKLDSRGEPYDYGSIMHYPWNAFSTNGRNTVKPKRRVVNPPYRVLSKSDAIQANRMYNCDKTRPKPVTRPPVPPQTDRPPVTGPEPVTRCEIKIVEERVTVSGCGGDQHRSCSAWARRGECRRNPSYMNKHCCRSCGAGGGSCTDRNRYCASWASRGECNRNPGYMNVNCKKSCRRCSTTTRTKIVKKRVKKCFVVTPTTEPVMSVMPPLPATTEKMQTPPIPEPDTKPPFTGMPPIPTTSDTNTTQKPQPSLPPPCAAAKKAGLEKGTITDKALSASSSYSSAFNASKGRLNGKSSWCPKKLDENQYLKIDLGKLSYIKGVSTQGLDTPMSQHVSRYYISYSEDDQLWNNVVGQSFWSIKEFVGNKDGKGIVESKIEPPVIARYVKIHPIKWKNYICMRAELHVC